MSFCVHGGAESARVVANSVRLITQATSLGATESLIEHRYSVEHPPMSPPNMLRFSVGLEDAADLARDLDRALAAMP